MKKKNIDPMDLKTITRWYLLAALFVLILFQLLFKSESTLSYIGEILSGLITMYGIYHFGKSTTPDRPDQTWANCLNLFVAGYTV